MAWVHHIARPMVLGTAGPATHREALVEQEEQRGATPP